MLNLYQLNISHTADSVFEKVLTQLRLKRDPNASSLDQLQEHVLRSRTTLIMIFDEADAVQRMLPEEQIGLMQGLRALKQTFDTNGRLDTLTYRDRRDFVPITSPSHFMYYRRTSACLLVGSSFIPNMLNQIAARDVVSISPFSAVSECR